MKTTMSWDYFGSGTSSDHRPRTKNRHYDIDQLFCWTSVEWGVNRNQYCEDHESRYVREIPLIRGLHSTEVRMVVILENLFFITYH